MYFHMTQLCSVSSHAAETITYAASVGKDDLARIASPKSVTCLVAVEVSDRSAAVRGICVLTMEFQREKHTSAPLRFKVGSSNHLNLSTVSISPAAFIFFYYCSRPLLTFSALVPPSQIFPIPISVQRQGTGSRPQLDFHTVPSTERHIELIRVNKCGGALLSRAPISLGPSGSAHTDGLG